MSERPADATIKGDVVGGVVAGILSLPEAMAYGAIVFVGLGPEYVSFGVIAGLTALALANLVGAFLGGVSIMSTGPYAMSSLMLSSAVALLVSQTTTGSPEEIVGRVLVLLFFIVFLAGAFQAVFGLSKFGDLAKYIPYPVVAGLANAIAILIFLGQIRPLAGLAKETSLFDLTAVRDGFQPLTLLTGVVTAAAIMLGPKLVRTIPGPAFGIGIGTGLYWALAVAGYRDSLGPLIGSIPFSIPKPGFGLEFVSLLGETGFFSTVVALVPLALGVAVVSSLRTLLGAVTIDNVTYGRSNTSKELVAQGCGNMVNALFGGVAVAGYSGQPLASYQNGGRTLRSRFVVGAFALSVLLFLGPVIGGIPVVVLAGTLVTLAYATVDRWSLGLVAKLLRKGQRSSSIALDLVLVLVVMVVMVQVGVFQGVGVGIVASIFSFVYRMSKRTIRSRYTAREVRSMFDRSRAEFALLDAEGHRIEVFELEGSLFFGATDSLAAIVEQSIASDVEWVILDFARVTDLDSTGAKLLARLGDIAREKGKAIVFSSVDPAAGTGRSLLDYGLADTGECRSWFGAIDEALGETEDRLLDRLLGEDRYDVELDLGQVDALGEMRPDELATFAGTCARVEYADGEPIFDQGDPGEHVYCIVKARIDLFLQGRQTSRGEEARATLIATLCPGTLCGEMAILDGKPRSARAVARGNLTCFRLSRQSLEQLEQQHPAISHKLLTGIGQELAKRIRQAKASPRG
ncbi:MAG: SulP family inorganic anion transporter [Acidobacteriota bacterium]|nr:SulP family inorganic anion transporter [Acidobacteriota bacterium]MDH3523267.1 SulP family inorganic anion transporter [Acidobacteriota bacterium]